VMFLAFLFGFQPTSWFSVIPAIGVMFLVALLFTSLGTMIASLLGDIQGFQSIMNFLVLPLFLLSGALFPLQGIPNALSLIARLDPLAYGVDALRALFTNSGYYGLGLDVVVLGAITLVCLTLSGYFFKKIQV